MTQLLPQALQACLTAAKKLPVEPSQLSRPASPPSHCGLFFDLWRNVLLVAPGLGMPELAQKFGPQPDWLAPATLATWTHRRVQCGDLGLAVGAY